jgi:hypothetical protein
MIALRRDAFAATSSCDDRSMRVNKAATARA